MKGIIAVILFIFSSTLWGLHELPDRLFHVYFLDVGQGDSILIKTPENHRILIDGGPGRKVINEMSGVMPFFEKNIDLMILTHPHADHVEGLIEVLKKYEVNNVLLTGVEYDSAIYEEFLKVIAEKNIDVFFADSSVDFRFGDVLLDTIYPGHQIDGETFSNVNNSSVAVRIIYGEIAILLTGDLQAESEKDLVANGIELKSNIFKAGHHGSKNASTLEFLKEVRPEIVVIQSGEENKYGHPHEETMENFVASGVKKVYRNDLDGRIEFAF